MEGCSGLLRSGKSEAVRMNLEVRGDVLVATGPGGANWNIPLTRVHLTSWAEHELRLELAGEPVSFVPEDPDRAIADLVPALVAHSRRAAPAAVGAPPTEPESRPLVVDITGSGAKHGPAGSPRRNVSPAATVAPAVRRRGWLVWIALAAAVGLAAFFAFAQLRSSSDEPAAAAARAALTAGGLPPVAVAVEAGRATVTGTVPSEEIAAAVAAAVAGVDGIETVVNSLEVTPGTASTSIPASSEAISLTLAADTALTAGGLEAVVVQVDDGGAAVLSGAVASELERRRAVAIVAGVSGVDRIEDLLTVAARPDETVQAAVRAALDAGGYPGVTAVVEGGVVTVTGVVPREELEAGFFRYADAVDAVVLPIEGVAGLRNRLQLAGDEATLRRQLRELIAQSPIVFALASADLTNAAAVTLDAAARIIQDQPGLRVLIAGHTDTTGSAGFNEELSRERAGAVRDYLIEQGVAANRLLVVAYGELFPSAPGAAPGDRRVEFEVAG